MGSVGLSIAFSALTVGIALVCLILASFGLYQGLGPSLAIGVGVMLLAALTLLPALISIFGSGLFWPFDAGGSAVAGGWGSVAARVVRRKVLVLLVGLVLIAALASGITGFRTEGFSSSAPSGTDSVAGDPVIAAPLSGCEQST